MADDRDLMSGDDGWPDERPTAADLRWQSLADQLPFEQLDATRRQAEGWRNALIAATALIGAVTVVHGRQNLDEIAGPWRYAAMAVLGAAFIALLSASVMATVAAQGRPGERIWATGSRYDAGLPTGPGELDGLL